MTTIPGPGPMAISLNFDSLNETFGFPPDHRDPSFFEAADRLMDLAGKYGFPLTIFMIGRDLENPQYAARVREWAGSGHEIGNHSWSHHYNLACLPAETMTREIERSHRAIADCVGIEPKGFIAASWANSRQMTTKLIELGYAYDTSWFPSALLYPMVLKIALLQAGAWDRCARVLNRRDWLIPLLGPRHPFAVDARGHRVTPGSPNSLTILPMPTVNRLSPAIWHTIGFELGWPLLYRHMDRLLASHRGFYYLIHPGDFLAPEEIDRSFGRRIPRMDVPLAEKLARLDDIFQRIAASGRPVVTMRNLAQAMAQPPLVTGNTPMESGHRP